MQFMTRIVKDHFKSFQKICKSSFLRVTPYVPPIWTQIYNKSLELCEMPKYHKGKYYRPATLIFVVMGFLE